MTYIPTTRQKKAFARALSKLTREWQLPKHIGERRDVLEELVDLRLAERRTSWGSTVYFYRLAEQTPEQARVATNAERI